MFREFDAYGNFEKPTMVLQNPTGKELYPVTHALDVKVVMRFIGYSDLTFTVPDTFDCGEYKVPYYNLLVQNRQVKVDGYGVFVITGVDEENDGISKKKNITCASLEMIFGTKSFIELEGTFPLYNPKPTNDPSILGMILELFPDWKIGTVDSDLWYVNRTYNITEQNVYDAIFNSFSEDYDCVFMFDTFAKTISVKTVKNAVKKTDIYISFENLAKKLNINTVENGIKTGLEVYGADGLSIRDVNPLGTSTIYDFSYYKTTEWIEQSTIDAINRWEQKVADNQKTYANTLTNLKARNSELIKLKSELVELESQKKAIDNVLAAQVEQGIDTSQKAKESEAKRKEIEVKKQQIKNKQIEVDNFKKILKDINNLLSFNTNFTQSEMNDINSILFVGTYSNDSFVITDAMTDNDIQDESQALMDLAKTVLNKEGQPRYTFDLECVNILGIKELSTYANQLEMGCEMTIRIDDDNCFNPVLLEYPIEFDNLPSCKMTFSNNLRMSNDKFTFTDMFKGMQSAVNSVSTNKGLWESFVSSGAKEDVKSMKNDALDLANKEILSSTGQAPTYDQTGIRCRKVLPNGEYDPKQLWMINNMIAMTDSNWTKTPKVAIGDIVWNGVRHYGVAASLIIGNLITGENVVVKDKNGTFDIVGNLLTVRDKNNNNKVMLGEYKDNTYGLKLFSNTGDVILDETGILQTWQDSKSDNVDNGYPLVINLYVPKETKSVRKALLRFAFEPFRAYSTATGGGGATSSTSSSGGGTSTSTDSGGETYINHTTTVRDTWTSGTDGHDHGIPHGTKLLTKDNVEGGSYVKWVESGDHTHELKFNIPEHSHDFYVPDHRHDFSISNHTHTIKYGIFQDSSNMPSGVNLYINGVKRGGAYYSGQNGINIAEYLKVDAWNKIELTSTRLGRIDASVFIQALMSTD